MYTILMAPRAGGDDSILAIIILIIIFTVAYSLFSNRYKTGNTFKAESSKKVLFSIFGAILGIPLSYYFQSSLVQNKVGGIGGYLKNFDRIIADENLVVNVILSVVIFAIVGALIGYFIDSNENK